MESLRRLRFVWALVCFAAAALCAVTLFGGFMRPGINPTFLFAWLVAALCCAFAFYLPTTAQKLSVLWLGGVGGFMLGAALTRGSDPGLVLMTLTGVGGVWVVAALLAWIVKPSVKSAIRSSS